MAKRKGIHDYYLELQVIDRHVKDIQSQVQSLEEQIMELKYVIQSISDIKSAKKGSRFLMPLSSGIFAEADLASNRELLVNVGANVVVRKSYGDVAKMMEKQIEELNAMKKQLQDAMQRLVQDAIAIDAEISRLAEEKKQAD